MSALLRLVIWWHFYIYIYKYITFLSLKHQHSYTNMQTRNKSLTNSDLTGCAWHFAGCVRLSVQTFGEFYSLASFLPRSTPLSLFAVSAPPDAPRSGFPGIDVDERYKQTLRRVVFQKDAMEFGLGRSAVPHDPVCWSPSGQWSRFTDEPINTWVVELSRTVLDDMERSGALLWWGEGLAGLLITAFVS